MNQQSPNASAANTALGHRIDAVAARLREVSDRIASEFTSEYERLKIEDPASAYDPRLGFADRFGKPAIDVAAIKYVLKAREHIAQKIWYLPYFEGVSSAFDIGVGPGQMFALLQDALGISMTGIDREGFQGEFLYRRLWKELQIADRISIFEVRVGVDVPIPQNVDAVLALWPIFDNGWGPAEHGWFLDMCRSHGAKHIYWKFNSHTRYDEVLPFYESLGGRSPRSGDKGFVILDL